MLSSPTLMTISMPSGRGELVRLPSLAGRGVGGEDCLWCPASGTYFITPKVTREGEAES